LASKATTNAPERDELSSQDFQVVFLDHDLHWMHEADNAIVQGTGTEVALVSARSGFGTSTEDLPLSFNAPLAVVVVSVCFFLGWSRIDSMKRVSRKAE
jgi:hypothetical protein